MLNSGIVKSGIKVFRKISVSLAKKFSIFQPLTRKVTDKARAISIYLDRRPFYDFVRQIPGVEHLGDGVFRSREGLIYKFQPYRKRGVENSLEHTYKKHALDATVTSGSRFNVNSKELPKLLDEAWATIKRKNIQKQISPSGNKFYELDLKRVIGN